MMASPIRCLVTAGPTREFFDPVRFLSNPSSGRMGYALARAARDRGWVVDLVSGPVELDPPAGVERTCVTTGEEMFQAVRERFPRCDMLIMTAAIMDYRPRRVAERKVKKHELEMQVEMEPVVDVLATVAAHKTHQVVVGFAAETDNLETHALLKLQSKNTDFIVANRIGGPDSAFGNSSNQVLVLSRTADPFSLGPLSKDSLAVQLLDRFEKALPQTQETLAR